MMRIRLTGLNSSSEAEEMVITEFPFTLGRHPDCHGQILHPLISRQHCRFYLIESEIWIQDLESMNGTTINGKLLEQPYALKSGDVLGLPCNHFTVKVCRKEMICGCDW